LTIGIAAGILFGGLDYLAYFLQLTNWGPSLLVRPLVNPDNVHDWQSQLFGIVVGIGFSVLISLLYAHTLVRWQSPWTGMGFGVVLWVICYVILFPLGGWGVPLSKWGLETNITEFCAFLLYGLFIGYSLSAELNDQEA
jgi:uncharacterized membrane protein YagU involved in acid resistance